jgi:hypothetical protein
MRRKGGRKGGKEGRKEERIPFSLSGASPAPLSKIYLILNVY